MNDCYTAYNGVKLLHNDQWEGWRVVSYIVMETVLMPLRVLEFYN